MWTASKETGINWLGKVPEHWILKSIKWCTRVKRGASPRPIDDPKYFDEEGRFAWVRIEDVTASVMYLQQTTQRLSSLGSSLSVRMTPGSLFLSIAGSVGKPCIASVECCIHDGFVYFPDWKGDARYLYYVFASGEPYRGLGKLGTQLNLNTDTVGSIRIAVPPSREQRALADFLDCKTAAIDALIAKKERLIELLQEKRQALITQAVTKGLDPNVPMKQSGIPWIGDVPSHWKVLAIKRSARPGRRTFTDGDWIETPYITEDGVRLIQTGNVGIGRYKEQGFRYVSSDTFRELRCTQVYPGDVLICRLDGPVGRACLAPDLGVKMITSVDNAILKPRADCDARYLVYVLSSPKYLDWVQVLCRVGGGFRFRVSRSMLGDIQIPLPPHAEQRQIADRLDLKTRRSLVIEDHLEVHCEKLREYRQALITAAVTGKMDVRKEAA